MTSMILASKGASPSVKSLMRDISYITPTVTETCFDIKKKISVIASYMDMNECDNTIFFECTKRVERMWISNGELSMRFRIHSLGSVYDLSTETNYHKNGGHVLLFSKDFNTEELAQTKTFLENAFRPVPDAPIERALCFFFVQDKIYMRNYLVEGGDEVGPRLELELEKILEGCFMGKTLFVKKVDIKKKTRADFDGIESSEESGTEENIDQ